MKRFRRLFAVWALVAALLAALCAPASAVFFLDVQEEDPYVTALSFTVRKGLLSEATPGRFHPDNLVTRATALTVLYRASGDTQTWPMPGGVPDLQGNDWYLKSACWALGLGLIQLQGGRLLPDEAITRAEFCRMLARYDGSVGAGVLPAADGYVFADAASLDTETRLAAARCAAAGILSCQSGGRIDPQKTITRAEFAQMVYRYFSLPGQTPLADCGETLETVPASNRWTGDWELDFPLSNVTAVSDTLVLWLNQRIIAENYPERVVGFGMKIGGDSLHGTNYGPAGYHDCYHVTTAKYNQKNGVDAGTALNGQQSYYGYTLQVSGVSKQDPWHQEAEDSGKRTWQCTWWAWGRAAQYLDTRYCLDFTAVCGGVNNLGNGGDYYRNLSRYFKSDMTPSANSIISWSNGSWGHVAYVEAVDAGGIWVSSADSGHSWRGVTYIPRSDNPSNPYPLSWYSYERCNGFNHLDYAADGTPIG